MVDILVRIMADELVIAVVILGAAALLFRLKQPNHRLQVYSRILMAGLTAYLIAKLVGSIYQPASERPFQQLGEAAGASYLDNPGFPSDHVLFCVAIMWAVWNESRSKSIAITITILAVLVALGRVLALVHSPLDVIGGAVIATIGTLWYLQSPQNVHAKNI